MAWQYRMNFATFLAILGVFCMSLELAGAKPTLGVYTGPAPYGPVNTGNYSKWLNSSVVYALDFEGDETWDAISNPTWLFGPWKTWVWSVPKGQRNLILSIPMLPRNVANVSIIYGSQGLYNNYFLKLAQNLVAYNLSSTVLRIGWEFNGDWYKWSAKPGCNYWIPFFQKIVAVMRSVPGNSFKVVWNPNLGYAAVEAPDCYPGNSWVDYIGIDSYDVDWSTYNWPLTQVYGAWSSTKAYVVGDGVEYSTSVWKCIKNNTNTRPDLDKTKWQLLANSTTLQAMRVKAWSAVKDGHLGLTYWSNFARNNSKPMMINEWGVWAQTHAGFDNDYYIQQMYNFIMNTANNVFVHSYFDVFASDGDHQLRPTTQFPRSSAKFKQLFGNGAATVANILNNTDRFDELIPEETGSTPESNLVSGANPIGSAALFVALLAAIVASF